jgi:Mn-dependent DtxR family transcriptional regulator
MDENSFIKLTPAGMEIANKIYTREKVLTRFFIYLGVDEKTAKEDACRIEHDLSEETFAALKKHVESLK